jgi:hypothetical protein
MFIHKSAEARLPGLTPIDPADGWLVSRWQLRQPRSVPPAPAAAYTGDPADAFWAFDGEMARAIHDHHAGHVGKKPQLLGFVQDGKTVPQVDRHEQVNLRFLPEEDGVSFSLETTFLDHVDDGSKNLARWTGLPAGTPLGHATGKTEVRRITGPFVETGPNRFAVRLNRTWIPSDPRHRQLWFAARNPGDGDYAPAVQQAMMVLPENEVGKPQRIDFPHPAPDGMKAVSEGVRLAATSDAGLKVRYYVREGPAVIEGDRLVPTRIPPRAKLPVAVTVVAWQLGNRNVNAAAPVAHRILFAR